MMKDCKLEFVEKYEFHYMDVIVHNTFGTFRLSRIGAKKNIGTKGSVLCPQKFRPKKILSKSCVLSVFGLNCGASLFWHEAKLQEELTVDQFHLFSEKIYQKNFLNATKVKKVIYRTVLLPQCWIGLVFSTCFEYIELKFHKKLSSHQIPILKFVLWNIRWKTFWFQPRNNW